MTQAILAQGWTVVWGSTTIDEATTFDIPVVAARVDVTNHDSDTGFREFISGLFEAIEITFTANHVDSHATFEDAAGDSTNVQALVMTSPMGRVYTVDAWVNGYTVHAPATGEAETIEIAFTTTNALVASGS
jgi:hypothetical protein